jgi:hypothetical protein
MAQDDRKDNRMLSLFSQSLAVFFGMVVGGAALITKYSGKLTTFRNLKSFARDSAEAKSAAYAVIGYAFVFGSGLCLTSAYVSSKLFIYRLGASNMEEAMREFKLASGHLNSSLDDSVGPLVRKLGAVIKEKFGESSFIKSLREIAEENQMNAEGKDNQPEQELLEIAKSFGLDLEQISQPISPQVLDRVRAISSSVKQQQQQPQQDSTPPSIQTRAQKLATSLNLPPPQQPRS